MRYVDVSCENVKYSGSTPASLIEATGWSDELC